MQTQTDPRPAPAAALHSPLGLLAELTHRCPLGCPYCSNPLELDRRSDELDTATWARVFREAAGLGVLQVHLSGGEPAARRDLVDIVAAARDAGLYTNLITSGVGVTTKLLAALADAGLDHVQISIQDSEAEIGRSHRRLRRRLCAQALARRRGGGAQGAAHRQHRHPSRQHRADRRARRAWRSRWAPPGSRSRTCSITAGRSRTAPR